MTYEPISLNGVPIVGFGDTAADEKSARAYGLAAGGMLLGGIAGAVSGWVLGRTAKKGAVVTAAAATTGGFFGAAAGIMTGAILARAMP